MSLRSIAHTVRRLHEAVTSGIRGPISPVHGLGAGGTKKEDSKRPIDPDSPIEPIEGRENGESGSKPAASFQAMVDTARSALLNGEDPHEAVEVMAGAEEGGDESQIIKAVQKAISGLDIKEPAPKTESRRMREGKR